MEIGLRISMELGLKTGRFGIPCGIRPKKNIYYGIRPNVKKWTLDLALMKIKGME